MIRGHDPDAATGQASEVLLNDRVLVHVDVHGRRDHDRRAGREEDRAEQIVGEAGGDLRDDVRRRRRDRHHVRRVGEVDVPDLGFLAEVEQIGRHGLTRQGLKGQRGDELLRVAGHDDPHSRSRLTELSDESSADL
jgi:hypothetical protein